MDYEAMDRDATKWGNAAVANSESSKGSRTPERVSGDTGSTPVSETSRRLRFEVTLTDDDEQAILDNVCCGDEESEARRRGICREYIENKVGELIRGIRESEES